MLNIFDYIKRYAKSHGITDYSLKSKYLSLTDFAKTQTFAPGVAFFYSLDICGEINTVDNLNSNLLTVTTNTDFYDFSKIVIFKDEGTLQHAHSDFLFECPDMMKLDLKSGTGAAFNKVFSAVFSYVMLTPISKAVTSNKTTNNTTTAGKQPLDVTIKY